MKISTPTFSLFYGKTNITEDLKSDLIELTYADLMEGESDELNVTFVDIEQKWINRWFPTQGDVLKPAIGYENNLVALGSFEIDEIEYQHNVESGTIVTIKALATGLKRSNRTLTPKAFENTTLDKVVATIAKKQKLKVVGKIEAIPIKRITQYQETDLQFLKRLGIEYRYSFKIVGDKLSFFPITKLEKAKPVRIISFEEIIDIQLRDCIRDAVKKVKVVGYNSKEKKTYISEKSATPMRPKVNQAIDENGDTLNITVRGESQEQVDSIAKAALAKKRENNQAGRLTVLGDPLLVAGQTIELTGLGVFTGKYLISRATHRLTRFNGYTTDLEIRMTEYLGVINETA